jgi:hypothetical protein
MATVVLYTTTRVDPSIEFTSTETITDIDATSQAADGCSDYPKMSSAISTINTIPTRQSSSATLKAASTTRTPQHSSKQHGAAIVTWPYANTTLYGSGALRSQVEKTEAVDCDFPNASPAPPASETSISVDYLEGDSNFDEYFNGIGAWSGYYEAGYEFSYPDSTDDELMHSFKSAPLNKGQLEDLESQVRREHGTGLRRSDVTASKLVKETAISYGLSPLSSIETTFSNELMRGPGIDALQTPEKSPFKELGPDKIKFANPLSTERRLFEPDYDSPYAAQSTSSSNSSQRPKGSTQRRGHWKNQNRSDSSEQPFPQQPISRGEPGVLPASLLGNNSINEQYISPQELPKMIRQPETRPISQEQLVAEVRGIYAGLVMVEGKCIQVDAKQVEITREATSGTQPKLNNEQWQALIALHRTLLHEHHDFFLASQHPSATPALRKLAIKYAMPARLWRHGIHSFLELLRHRLPDSLDHMLSFIYLAYSMMTLLYETVPALEETWIECLGDLGCYRMAIEDDDIRDREVWTQVARQWYLKASHRSLETGRLYHHLAILARPNALLQLFYLKILKSSQSLNTAEELFQVPENDSFRPTPEEFEQRGLFWAANYFIPSWFRNKNIEDENQYKEDASMNTEYRPERILWLGRQLAQSGKWICYSNDDHKFSLQGPDGSTDTPMTSATELELDSSTQLHPTKSTTHSIFRELSRLLKSFGPKWIALRCTAFSHDIFEYRPEKKIAPFVIAINPPARESFL